MARDPFTVVQLSDLHLNPKVQRSIDCLSHLRQRVGAIGPDLMVVTGDVTNDGFRDTDSFAWARHELERFGVPMHVVPGNHDVGAAAVLNRRINHDPSGDVRKEHVDAWLDAYEADRFAVQHGRWTLIGLNSQIMGAGLIDAERRQLEWLDREISAMQVADQYVAVFMHTLPYMRSPDEQIDDMSAYWSIPPSALQVLMQRLQNVNLRLFATGHVHWYASFLRDPVQHVWCPSLTTVIDDPKFPRGGDKIGFVLHTFEDETMSHQLVELDIETGEPVQFHRKSLDIPGRGTLAFENLALDFTGTLSRDGMLLPGVAPRLIELAKQMRITVMTADTFGKVDDALADLPVEVHSVKTGQDKARMLADLNPQVTVAIGNGRNDVAMVQGAVLGIAVCGPEGLAGELIRVADIVCRDILEALDLLVHRLRIKATLRD